MWKPELWINGVFKIKQHGAHAQSIQIKLAYIKYPKPNFI